MAIALHDPELGYYATRQPLGSGGDFVTAPEISQIFGELIGLWCALMWEQMGRPDPVTIVEFGPGSGALVADLLRAAKVLPAFRRAIRLHLVEVSPVLRAIQRRRLGTAEVIWLARPEELPEGPLLVVANEFLDALPIRQLVRGCDGWGERMVALDQAGNLTLADTPESRTFSLLVPKPIRDTSRPGAVFEVCPPAVALAAMLGSRFARWPGAALFIDYGRATSAVGASLRGVSGHRPVGVLDAPGCTDLSADVDFEAFAAAAVASGAAAYGPLPQGLLLRALGAATRMEVLSARASAEQRQRLESGLERLLDPAQMGSLFKAMAVTSPGLPTPPGFETTEPMQ